MYLFVFAFFTINARSFFRGKPRRGRTSARDGRKIRQSSDLDPDEEDDPDLSSK